MSIDNEKMEYIRIGEAQEADLILHDSTSFNIKQIQLDFDNYPKLEEQSLYSDMLPTDLQFELKSNQFFDEVKIEIPYKNRLTTMKAKHAKIYLYHNDQWEKLDHRNSTSEKSFIFSLKNDGIIVIGYNNYWYSSFTQTLADEYPSWTRIRKYKDSIGQQFLNFFGMELEDINEWIKWVDGEKHLSTADYHMLDWVYIYPLPEVKQEDTIRIFYELDNEIVNIPIYPEVKQFFINETNTGGIVDYEQRRFYSKQKFNEIRGVVKKESAAEEFTSHPIPFHIWNTFDEFGLLLNIKRLHMETNKQFKERLLDVFRYPANSSNTGLSNGIAQELNLIKRTDDKELLWENDRKSFIIHNESGIPIDPNSIKVDYQLLDSDDYVVTEDHHVLIYPRDEYKKHIVSFIYGLEKYELHDKKDKELQKLIFQADGQATEKLINWVAYINTIAPIFWDRFKWDEGYWDTVSKELSGVGFIPNMWDSDISVWKDYTFIINRWEDKEIWR